jgi:mRNA-degrading endonuclease RelE of RelBE toxin-antitoxin system
MPNETTRVAVDYTSDFKRHVRALSKKYHHIRSDIQPTIDAIERGEFLGDRIQGTGSVVFKVRVMNRDIRKGKSSGYRIIYEVETPESVLMIDIYSKLDQGDISPNRIREIISEKP